MTTEKQSPTDRMDLHSQDVPVPGRQHGRRRERKQVVPVDELSVIVAHWAAGKEHIARVLLFGSRVRGVSKDGKPVRPRYGPNSSDLDVAVEIIHDSKRQRLEEAIAYLDRWRPELQALLPVRLHLQRLDARETPFVAQCVADCSRLIYDRLLLAS